MITTYKLVDKFGGDFEQISNELFFNENGLEYMCYFYEEDGSLLRSEIYIYEDSIRKHEEEYEELDYGLDLKPFSKRVEKLNRKVNGAESCQELEEEEILTVDI